MAIPSNTPVLTIAQVKEKFDANGWTVKEWADQHGFDPQVVYTLLSGRSRGRRGQAHHAAVALGLKPRIDPDQIPDFLKPPV